MPVVADEEDRRGFNNSRVSQTISFFHSIDGVGSRRSRREKRKEEEEPVNAALPSGFKGAVVFSLPAWPPYSSSYLRPSKPSALETLTSASIVVACSIA